MVDQPRGRTIVADHERLRSAVEPRLRGFVPAQNIPIEGANQTQDKAGTTLNRAGSSAANPILSGLGHRLTGKISSTDTLTGVNIYQERSAIGPNQLALAHEQAAGVFSIDLVAGTGRTKAGSPATAAKRNFIRWKSRNGSVEKEFYIKTFDFDVVALNGIPALDPITFLKTCITVKELPGGIAFIEIIADWMVSWNDEFGALHRRDPSPFLKPPGFLKSYGGAKFVSVFDTSTATEGVGVQVSPQTQIEIKDLHGVLIQNTTGQKDFTVRFRSKKDSPFTVDVDVCVLVIADPCAPSDPPEDENPTIDDPTGFGEIIPPATPPIIPNDLPGEDIGGGNFQPGSPESPTVPVAFPDLLEVKMTSLTVQGQTTGGTPTMVVRRFVAVADLKSAGGFAIVFLDQKEYIPLVVSGATKPTKGAPYQAAEAYRVAFQTATEELNNVIFYGVMLRDGGLYSKAQFFGGPAVLQLSALFQLPTGVSQPSPPV